MSKRLLEKQNSINTFLEKIVATQTEEIQFMKRLQMPNNSTFTAGKP